MGKKFDMLALGEVLLRLSPEGNERLTQGTRFEKQLGGAELNVAVGAANLGLTTGIISKIPSHAITTTGTIPIFLIFSNTVFMLSPFSPLNLLRKSCLTIDMSVLQIY